MDEPLVEIDEQVIGHSRSFLFSDRGLRVVGTPSYQEWEEVGVSLYLLGNSVAWALGDWLSYGEGRGDWGETYTQAIDLTKKSYDSLSQYARVSREFTFEARFKSLSWSHHQAVLSLPLDERRVLLQRCESEEWSREELREHLREERAARQDQLRHLCPKCGWRW